jgi:hypothetical protein
MSLKFVHEFHLRIYKTLTSNRELRTKVDKIYLASTQETKYPFLLIKIVSVKNLSKPNFGIYEVHFEISAFARDKTQGILMSLADSINQALIFKDEDLEEYIIAGLNLTNVEFTQGQDLITTKLNIEYKTLLKQKEV